MRKIIRGAGGAVGVMRVEGGDETATASFGRLSSCAAAGGPQGWSLIGPTSL